MTLGADKGYDAADFVNELRALNVRPHVRPHVAQNSARGRGSAVYGRTTRNPVMQRACGCASASKSRTGERKFDALPSRHLALIDLPRRQPQLLDPLMARIDHKTEIDFALQLTRDLEHDDPGRIGIETRLLHDDFRG
jgi:hypothetical protein